LGLFAILVGIALNMALLWIIIKHITGNTKHVWREMFMWALFITLLSTLKYPMMLISTASFFMAIVGILNTALVGAAVYFLLGFRLGILNPKQKMQIVGYYIGAKILIGLIV